MTRLSRYLPALLLTAGVAFASPACAARIYDTGYPRAGYPPPPPREAYVSIAARNGHRDGFDEGHHDARHHDRFDPIGARRYRDSDHDYDRRYGPREEYRRDYRIAFERGYREGYDRGR